MNNDDRERRNEDISKDIYKPKWKKQELTRLVRFFRKRTNESLWVNFNFKIL